MKDLLGHGLNIDAENGEGLTALQISMAEDHDDMVRFLIMNGAKIEKVNTEEWERKKIVHKGIEEMVQKREIGYPIAILKSPNINQTKVVEEQGHMFKWDSRAGVYPRASVYRGHPLLRKPHSEAGKLIRLPNTTEELKKIIGMYYFLLIMGNKIAKEPHKYSFDTFLQERSSELMERI